MLVTVPSLPASVAYSEEVGVVRWEGYEVSDDSVFRTFLKGRSRDA